MAGERLFLLGFLCGALGVAGCRDHAPSAPKPPASTQPALPSAQRAEADGPPRVARNGTVFIDPPNPPRPHYPIEFAKAISGRYVLNRSRHGGWNATCSILQPLPAALKPLPRCADDLAFKPWPELSRDPDALVGKHLVVSGVLGASSAVFSTLVACGAGSCCNGRGAEILLDAPDVQLALAGLSCHGDESRLVCDAPADGRTLVASGKLERTRDRSPPWHLVDVTLCEPPKPELSR